MSSMHDISAASLNQLNDPEVRFVQDVYRIIIDEVSNSWNDEEKFVNGIYKLPFKELGIFDHKPFDVRHRKLLFEKTQAGFEGVYIKYQAIEGQRYFIISKVPFDQILESALEPTVAKQEELYPVILTIIELFRHSYRTDKKIVQVNYDVLVHECSKKGTGWHFTNFELDYCCSQINEIGELIAINDNGCIKLLLNPN